MRMMRRQKSPRNGNVLKKQDHTKTETKATSLIRSNEQYYNKVNVKTLWCLVNGDCPILADNNIKTIGVLTDLNKVCHLMVELSNRKRRLRLLVRWLR
ncbi:1398_t:CDS:2 [Rhizophagus irregularis]|nr:1398_t:CDS:2 [Rhizophagus irregularis]